MKAKSWKQALASLKEAETWPANLGSGEPYYPDNRLTQFLAAYCYNKIKDKGEYDKSLNYLSCYKNPDGWTNPLEEHLSLLIKGGNNDFKAITEALINDKGKNRNIEILKTFLAIL
jgi:hypothetical protein